MTDHRAAAGRRTAVAITAGGLALVVLAGCAADPDGSEESARPATQIETGAPESPAEASGEAPASAPEVLATGLEAPWSVVPLDAESFLVSERDSGRILHLSGGESRAIGEVEGVSHGGEGGLLGLALAPDDAAGEQRRLFVYFTSDSGNRVVSYALTGDGEEMALGEREDVLTGIPSAGTHNGGRIAFGPDGHLYISTGDAGDRSAPRDPDSLAGKILRLAPDGSVPADNPTEGSPVYSRGHRNVQGLAWDDAGRLWSSEFGANTWDELNLIEPGGDYGWPEVEGFDAGGSAGGGASGEDAAGGEVRDPVRVWATEEASPSGLAFVDGTLVMASLRGERLWTIEVPEGEPQVASADDQLPAEEHLGGEYGRIRDVVAAPDGEAILVLTNNTDGRGRPGPDDDRLLRIPLP